MELIVLMRQDLRSHIFICAQYKFPTNVINKNVKKYVQILFDRCTSKCKRKTDKVIILIKDFKKKGVSLEDYNEWEDTDDGVIAKRYFYIKGIRGTAYRGLGNKNGAGLNFDKIREGEDPDWAMATSIAHEIGHHGILEESHNPGDLTDTYIDDQLPPGNKRDIYWSHKTCQELLKELGLD